MATKIRAQVLGGTEKVFEDGEVNTVRDVKARLGVPAHAASINGDTASDDDELPDYAFVSLSPAVKAGI